MDFFDAVAKRYSYRGQYRPDPVPREDLLRILEAGLAAPSGCNLQTTSLIAVDDPAVMSALGAALGIAHFASAPAAICVLTQPLTKRPGSACYAVQDYGAAIENILLAITALGYVSCWVEGDVVAREEVRRDMSKVLALPEDVNLVAYLPVGLPASKGKRVLYKPFEERAWFNRYRA